MRRNPPDVWQHAAFGTRCYPREFEAGAPRIAPKTRMSDRPRQERRATGRSSGRPKTAKRAKRTQLALCFQRRSEKNEPNPPSRMGRSEQNGQSRGRGWGRQWSGQDTYRRIDRRQTGGSRHGAGSIVLQGRAGPRPLGEIPDCQGLDHSTGSPVRHAAGPFPPEMS